MPAQKRKTGEPERKTGEDASPHRSTSAQDFTPQETPSKRRRGPSMSTLPSMPVPSPHPAPKNVRIPFGITNPASDVFDALTNTLRDGIPIYAFVNLAATKLFREVTVSLARCLISDEQDMVGFGVACCVFWLSFFANQRFCPKESRDALLAQVTSSCKGNFFERHRTETIQVWENVYSRIVDGFVSKFNDFAEEWTRTKAGIAFLEHLAQLRWPPLLTA